MIQNKPNIIPVRIYRDRDCLVPVYVGTGIITFVRDTWSRPAGARHRGKFIIPVPMYAGTGIIWSRCTSRPGLSPSCEKNGAGAGPGAAGAGRGAASGLTAGYCTLYEYCTNTVRPYG